MVEIKVNGLKSDIINIDNDLYFIVEALLDSENKVYLITIYKEKIKTVKDNNEICEFNQYSKFYTLDILQNIITKKIYKLYDHIFDKEYLITDVNEREVLLSIFHRNGYLNINVK